MRKRQFFEKVSKLEMWIGYKTLDQMWNHFSQMQDCEVEELFDMLIACPIEIPMVVLNYFEYIDSETLPYVLSFLMSIVTNDARTLSNVLGVDLMLEIDEAYDAVCIYENYEQFKKHIFQCLQEANKVDELVEAFFNYMPYSKSMYIIVDQDFNAQDLTAHHVARFLEETDMIVDFIKKLSKKTTRGLKVGDRVRLVATDKQLQDVSIITPNWLAKRGVVKGFITDQDGDLWARYKDDEYKETTWNIPIEYLISEDQEEN